MKNLIQELFRCTHRQANYKKYKIRKAAIPEHIRACLKMKNLIQELFRCTHRQANYKKYKIRKAAIPEHIRACLKMKNLIQWHQLLRNWKASMSYDLPKGVKPILSLSNHWLAPISTFSAFQQAFSWILGLSKHAEHAYSPSCRFAALESKFSLLI